MVKTLGDYIREAEAKRNLEKLSWYMPQCQRPFSPPPYEPYSNYWDDYEPPPYSSNWDNYEQLQVQRKEEEYDIDEALAKLMEQANERLDRIEKNMDEKLDRMEGQIGAMNNNFDSLKNQLSKVIDMVTTQLAEENLYLQSKSTPNEESEQYKDNILSNDEEFSVEANLEEEALKKDEETPTEGSQIETTDSTDESGCEENEKDPLVQDLEKEEKTQIFGQIVLTIGDAAIEVHRGKVTLRSGKEEDVIKALNSYENFSSLTSHYFDYVVETNISGDLKMQDLLEKNIILQDPSIVVGGNQIKIQQPFEVHPPLGKRKNNVNHMVRKLRRCTALDVKFALGEPPD